MSDRVKRVVLVVAFLVFVTGISAFMYWVFFRSGGLPGLTPTTPVAPGTGTLLPSGTAGDRTPTTPTGSGGLPTAGETPGGAPGSVPAAPAQTLLLRDGVTQNVSPSASGRGARYYSPDDGKFYRVESGVTTALSDATFPDAESITWGNASDQAIITFPDGRNLRYDFRTDKQDTLPSHWEAFSFSPNDQKIVSKAMATSPGSRFLVMSDADGSNPTAIEPLGENGNRVTPVWTPNNQIIAFSLTGNPQGFDRQEVLLIGQNHENFRALQVEGRGFLPRWSPDGSTVLYSIWSAESDYKPELWVSGGSPNTINQNRTKLQLNTWADKCVWKDVVTIYCAVPESLPRGAGLQPELFRNTEDTLVKIDLRSGAQLRLGAPNDVSTIQNPVLTDDGSALLFTDGQTGRLFQFNLP